MRTRDEKKEQVIRQKAVQMIVRDGIDHFSVQKLAKEAGVSPATMYIYFKNREDLLLQLYADVSTRMFDAMLTGFDSSMSFEQGLRIQWKNRMEYALGNHEEVMFVEQMRTAPVHDKAWKMVDPRFRQVMEAFVHNAVKNKELVKVSFEIYWSVAFAPLYNLIRLHRTGISKTGEKFVLDQKIMNKTLDLVIKALKP